MSEREDLNIHSFPSAWLLNCIDIQWAVKTLGLVNLGVWYFYLFASFLIMKLIPPLAGTIWGRCPGKSDFSERLSSVLSIFEYVIVILHLNWRGNGNLLWACSEEDSFHLEIKSVMSINKASDTSINILFNRSSTLLKGSLSGRNTLKYIS